MACARKYFQHMRSALLLLAIWVSGTSRGHAGDTWPSIPLPPDVSAFSVGEQLTSNGMPMRVQGFVASGQSVTQLADWFRRKLGQPLVEDQMGSKLILGRAQEGFYLTVQIEPSGTGGSKGLVAVSDVKSMAQSRDRHTQATIRWLNRWPSGSELISQTSSNDVLSGLISRKTTTSIDKVPGLGDLPILGALFRSTRFQNDETELVVFVTPTIIDSQTPSLVDRVQRANDKVQPQPQQQPQLPGRAPDTNVPAERSRPVIGLDGAGMAAAQGKQP